MTDLDSATPSLADSDNPNFSVEGKPQSLQASDASSDPSNADHPQRVTLRQEIGIFTSTFLTILVAEVGDKTQLTTLLIAAESRSPWTVFLGAGSALVATSLLGVLLGRWLATQVSPEVLETIVGAILIVIAILLLWDVVNV